MKKKDVKVGSRYEAKVSGSVCVVVIDQYDEQRGKWSGRNTVTGRKVGGDFRRLRREVQSATSLMDSVVGSRS